MDKSYFQKEYVDYIVKITCIIINDWPLKKHEKNLMDLEKFIKYILKKLNITNNTLIISLIYLTRLKHKISENNIKDKYVLSNRRMFIISIILANNMLGYKNKEWARITGLCDDEILNCKNKFLDVIYPDIYISNNCLTEYKNKIKQSYKNY